MRDRQESEVQVLPTSAAAGLASDAGGWRILPTAVLVALIRMHPNGAPLAGAELGQDLRAAGAADELAGKEDVPGIGARCGSDLAVGRPRPGVRREIGEPAVHLGIGHDHAAAAVGGTRNSCRPPHRRHRYTRHSSPTSVRR